MAKLHPLDTRNKTAPTGPVHGLRMKAPGPPSKAPKAAPPPVPKPTAIQGPWGAQSDVKRCMEQALKSKSVMFNTAGDWLRFGVLIVTCSLVAWALWSTQARVLSSAEMLDQLQPF